MSNEFMIMCIREAAEELGYCDIRRLLAGVFVIVYHIQYNKLQSLQSVHSMACYQTRIFTLWVRRRPTN